MTQTDAPHDLRRRRDAPALELRGGQHAGPGVEELQRVGAGQHLAAEILDGGVDEHRGQLGESLGRAQREGRRGFQLRVARRLGDEALAIGVALVVSTLVGLASAALTMVWLMKRKGA